MTDETTHLYRHFNSAGDLIYVGISMSALRRLTQHAVTAHWFSDISRVEVERFDTRDEAIAAEIKAIRSEKPLHNVEHSPSAKAVSRSSRDPARLTSVIEDLGLVYAVGLVSSEIADDVEQMFQENWEQVQRVLEHRQKQAGS